MKAGLTLSMLTALFLAGCGGSGDAPKNEVIAAVVPKTVLTDEQFAEIKVNCDLDDAELKSATSTQMTTDENGITATEMVTYDGPANQKTILLHHVVGEEGLVQLQTCLKAEFERLGAEARLQPPEMKGP